MIRVLTKHYVTGKHEGTWLLVANYRNKSNLGGIWGLYDGRPNMTARKSFRMAASKDFENRDKELEQIRQLRGA